MATTNQEIPNGVPKGLTVKQPISPSEFIYRYLHYLPWVVLSIIFFTTVAYLKIRWTTEIYRVESSILIKSDNDQSPGSGGDQNGRFEELFLNPGQANLSNETSILRSRPVLERVVADLNLQARYLNKGKVKSGLLYPNYPFVLDATVIGDSAAGLNYKVTVLPGGDKFSLDADKRTYNFGEVIDKDRNRFRLVRNPFLSFRLFGSMNFEMSWLPMPDVVQDLMDGLKVFQENERSTILTLTFDSESPLLGKDVLNTLMAVYDTLVVEDKKRIANNTLRFINDRLSELSDTLRRVQGGLEDFMVKHNLFDVENQSKSYLEKIGESNSQVRELQVKGGIVDFMLEYVDNKKNQYELVPTILGIEEPAFMNLVNEYNHLQLERESNLKTTAPNNPMIVGLDNSLDKIRKDITEALLNVKHSYGIASTNLEKGQSELQGQITALPGNSIQSLNITRRQKILDDLYSLLLQKKLDISLSSASTISNSRVVEPAIGSAVAVLPEKKKTYTLYLMMGLLIPLGIIALKELMKDKVGGRADVEKNTNAPIIGQIGHSETENSLVVTHNSRRLISEQFRIVRSNLQYMIGKKEKPVIMVTSSFSGEGKSFISTNVGAVMALSGKKTVIMEFDIRKPKILSGLELKRKLGITNYIIGKAEFEDLLVKVDGVDDLYVIPCGPIPPNPAELLLDKRLDQLMRDVKENFEVIIMDTAPIGLVSDATSLARYADCTLYIIREGYTFQKHVSIIEELYLSRKLPSLCLLLNDTNMGGGYYGGYYSKGYGQGRSYGYGAGYFEDDANSRKGNIFKRILFFWKNLF
jgi:tyrosine-protein kinase Etk/Wzc